MVSIVHNIPMSKILVTGSSGFIGRKLISKLASYPNLQVPNGCAPAFQTLEDDTLLHYYVSNAYSPKNEFGIRFNDPFFRLKWPLEVSEVSERDQSFPDFDLETFSGLKG